jgi:O-antigen ligase
MIILLAYVFVINNVIGFKNVKNVFYLTMLFKVIGKIIIEIFAFTNLASQEVLNKFYILVFHTSPVFMRLEYGNLLRIQTPSDVLPIIIFGFYLLQKDRFYKKTIVTALMTLFVIIVYSRLFFIQYVALVGLVGVLYFLEKYGIKKVIIAFSALIVIFTSAMFMSHGASKIEKIITARFISADTVKSDAVRGDQTQALINVFLKSPVIGKGVGAYAEELIRNVDNSFSYEEEYLSFLMQLGIIGFTLIIIGSIVLFFRILNVSKVKDKKIKILIIFNFIFWAIRPLFNPGFLSSNSGIIIVILMFYSYYYYADVKVDEVKGEIEVAVD